MCEPVTLTMAGLGAASAAASIAGSNTQRQLGKGMENQKRLAQDDLIAENRRRATKDYLRQVSGEQLQQAQEEQSVAEKSFDVSRQAVKTTATGYASAAERNVAGRTIDQIASDYDFQADLEIGRIKENQKLRNLQHRQNLEGYRDQFTQRVSSVKPYVPKTLAPVDYFGPIFGAVGQTIGTGVQAGAFKDVGRMFSSSNINTPAAPDAGVPLYADGE